MKEFKFVAKVSTFNKPNEDGSPNVDSNGMQPVIMTPIYGSVPRNAMVIAGTIAANEGINPGSTCLVQVRETGVDEEYGMQFRHTFLGNLTPIDLLNPAISTALGQPLVIGQKEEEVENNAMSGAEVADPAEIGK